MAKNGNVRGYNQVIRSHAGQKWFKNAEQGNLQLVEREPDLKCPRIYRDKFEKEGDIYFFKCFSPLSTLTLEKHK